jgi:transcriptional regulator with XRE-family HTH domain
LKLDFGRCKLTLLMQTLGEKLRELRDANDISLRELAKKIDCSPAHLSDIELGRRYPSAKILARIARELNVQVEDLEKYDHRPPIGEMKRRAEKDPQLGLAFRRVMDGKVSGEQLLNLLDKVKKKE